VVKATLVRHRSGSKEHEFKGYGRFKVSIEELKRTRCAKHVAKSAIGIKECTNKPKPKEREAHFLDKDLGVDGTSEIHFFTFVVCLSPRRQPDLSYVLCCRDDLAC